MKKFPKIAVVGGGNMANALISGWLKQDCPVGHLHVVEVFEPLRKQWESRGVSVAALPDHALSECDVWIYAVKPQQMREVVLSTKPFLKEGTLVISIAAGISMHSLSKWLSTGSVPYEKIVRCMPNTPALVAAGVTGLVAPASLTQLEKQTAADLLSAVGQVVWVDSDQAIDAVTALSGSGPAYVFLFLEALIAGGIKLGLSESQSRELALATLSGATQLARESAETPAVLRERVTSKGGTTAAALDVFQSNSFAETIAQAMEAASRRAAEMSEEFGK